MGDDGGGGDGGGFGPQDQGSERDRRPSGGGGSGPFRVRPAAFWTGRERNGIRPAAPPVRRDGGSERGRAGLLVQEIAEARARRDGPRDGSVNGNRKRLRFTDFRRTQPARLLAAFVRDAPPALDPFAGGFQESLLAARGVYGNDGRNAQFGGFLDQPLETIELDEGGVERQAHGRRRRVQRFDDAEDHAFLFHGGDLGQIDASAVGDFVLLSGFGAQHAGEMAGILAEPGQQYEVSDGARLRIVVRVRRAARGRDGGHPRRATRRRYRGRVRPGTGGGPCDDVRTAEARRDRRVSPRGAATIGDDQRHQRRSA